MKPQPFAGWAIVEILGHRISAGLCSVEVLVGVEMLRVDVPEPSGGFATQYYSGPAIFGLFPCGEEEARAMARARRPHAVHEWVVATAPAAAPTTEPCVVCGTEVNLDEAVHLVGLDGAKESSGPGHAGCAPQIRASGSPHTKDIVLHVIYEGETERCGVGFEMPLYEVDSSMESFREAVRVAELRPGRRVATVGTTDGVFIRTRFQIMELGMPPAPRRPTEHAAVDDDDPIPF